jgi:hypothetical protein
LIARAAGFDEGHGFSRAIQKPLNTRALAAGEWFFLMAFVEMREKLPQRLKPHWLECFYGTAEAVPFLQSCGRREVCFSLRSLLAGEGIGFVGLGRGWVRGFGGVGFGFGCLA